MHGFRFKINLTTNDLKTYINVMLEILKQTISSDVIVVRKYKKSAESLSIFEKSVPKLLNNNAIEPSHADISKVNITLFV